jgi:hypothetical protein
MANSKNKYFSKEDVFIDLHEYLNKIREPKIEDYDVSNLKSYLTYESNHKKWKDYMQSKVVNKTLERKLSKIIKKELNKECRAEALSLFKLASQDEIGKFLYYVYSTPNTAPCVIDSIKDRLCKEGVLKYNEDDAFGLTSNPEFHID